MLPGAIWAKSILLIGELGHQPIHHALPLPLPAIGYQALPGTQQPT